MTSVDAASLILRVIVGLTIIAHGYNHLFGSGGIDGTAGWFESMGLRPPKLHALLSGAGELSCGAAFVAGFLTPVAAAFIVGTMTVAGVTAHRRNGFFIFRDGYEYVLVIAVVACCVALLGPGRASADHGLGLDTVFGRAVNFSIAAVGGVLGAVALLTACWRPVERAVEA